MTKKFDDNSREQMKKEFKNFIFESKDVEVNKIKVSEISCKEARKYIASFHYSKTMPDSSKFCFAGYYEGEIIGVVVYGMGAGKSQYTSVISDIQNGEYIELTRLWCANDMPKNTESKIIGQSLKMLPKEIKLVISFADSSKQHCGTIYQATNWNYLGCNSGGKVLVCEDGIVKHTRLLGIYKQRHPELKKMKNEEIMDMYGWKYAEGGKKHRYVYLRGNKKDKKIMLKEIEERILPYPKNENIIKNSLSEQEILFG